MGTTETTPTPTPEPITAPPKPEPTPLDPPKMFYNKKWRVPGLFVETQEDADALDPSEWSEYPPPPAAKAADPQYPKLYANVNLPPKIVGDAADEKALSSDWREFDLPDSLCKAAEAANAAKAQAASAKGKGQAPSHAQSQTPAHTHGQAPGH